MSSRGICLTGIALLTASMACRGDTAPASRTEPPAEADSLPAPAARPNTGWDSDAAGPAVLLSIPDNGAAAWAVLPFVTDSILAETHEPEPDSVAGIRVELFSRGGLAGPSSTIADMPQEVHGECLAWPRVRLAEIPARSWRFGLLRGTATALPLDSLEAMNSADSARITRELARISSIVAEGDDPAFRGLPFSVRKAYRFTIPGAGVLVGDVVRRIPEEANPREERLLVVAERPSPGDGEYTSAFHTRVAGPEEAVRTTELLGAFTLVRGNTPSLLLLFDYETGTRAALVQRTANRTWRMTWRSAFTDC